MLGKVTEATRLKTSLLLTETQICTEVLNARYSSKLETQDLKQTTEDKC